MAVSADFAERLIYDFKESAREVVSKYDLAHLRGTDDLLPVTSVAAEFVALIQNNYAKESTTESMLESEKRMYLRTIEQKSIEVSKLQKQKLATMAGLAAPTAVADKPVWKPVVKIVAQEIERVAIKFDMFFKASPNTQARADKEFAKILDSIKSASDTQSDPKTVQRETLREVKKIERKLASDQRKFVKMNKVKEPKVKVVPENSISGYVSGLSAGSQIPGLFGGTHGRPRVRVPPAKPLAGPPPTHAYKVVPPGMAGFAGVYRAEDIREQLPNATNPAHIRAIEYFMNQGLTFDEAQNAANTYGFEPNSGAASMDLDLKINHLGGGADPFF